MLSKRYRLTKRGSFNYVYKNGSARNSGALRLTYVLSKGGAKIGISVPNSVGKAVVRNKVRRRIRACLADLVKRTKSAQIVISARKGAEDLSYSQICESVTELFDRAQLFKPQPTDGAIPPSAQS